MPYKNRPPPTYSQPKYSPAPQYRRELQTFRSEWLQGYDKAMFKVHQLTKQGWRLNSKTALTESQAKKMISDLEKEGFETRFIPAATWIGQKIGFLMVKLKPERVKPAGQQAQLHETQKPKTSKVKLPPTGVLQDRFTRMFNLSPILSNPDAGLLMDTRHLRLFILAEKWDWDKLTDEQRALVKAIKGGRMNLEACQIGDFRETAIPQQVFGKVKRLATTDGIIRFAGNAHLSAKEFLKVPRLLGTRNLQITIDPKKSESPVRFVNQRGDELIVASTAPKVPGNIVDFYELLQAG